MSKHTRDSTSPGTATLDHRGPSPQAGIFNLTATSSTQRRHARQSHLFEEKECKHKGTIPWGDEISGQETTGCRFLCQNVNGISNTDHLSKAHEIGEAARDFGVNILGLIETNVDWSYGDIRAIITNTLDVTGPIPSRASHHRHTGSNKHSNQEERHS